MMDTPWERVMQTADRLGIKPADRLLAVRIETQTLQFYRGPTLVKAYPISTSARPPSNLRHSLGTPRGLHEIAERIGAGQPPGMVFRSRVPTGQHYRELSDDENVGNLITSRILWLRGLEPGLNCGENVDSYQRYIYLHGTNHEDRIGTPASGGCVLLRNLDLVELYEHVRAGDWVWIE
jgi:hypothetical protein